MNTIKSFLASAFDRLIPIYNSPSEVKAITQALLMDKLAMSQTDLLLTDKDTPLSEDKWASLCSAISRLEQNEPLQYILGYAYFLDFKLEVSPSVLIPRPETEELVHLLTQTVKQEYSSTLHTPIRILDIGTGSACIPIALARLLRKDAVEAIHSIDVSSEALQTAQKNIDTIEHNIPIKIQEANLFTLPVIEREEGYDIIVSNPPYIHPKEADEMIKQVLDWEPTTALFAPSERPTIFYDEIARLKHKGYLKNKAHIFLEINPLYAQETLNNMRSIIGKNNIHLADILNDMYGKERFIHIQIQE